MPATAPIPGLTWYSLLHAAPLRPLHTWVRTTHARFRPAHFRRFEPEIGAARERLRGGGENAAGGATILREAGRYLARPPRLQDVRSQWVGLRPLVRPAGHEAGETRSISREHTVQVSSSGLVTVTGGKWTTYRAMADDVLERCFAAQLLPRRAGGLTDTHPLDGSPQTGEPAVPLHMPPGPHLFGQRAAELQGLEGADRGIGLGLTEAMVRHMARCEYAHTVEDVLARRWRALFLDARQAAAMAPSVAALLQDEGVLSPRLDAFLALCQHYLPAKPTHPAGGV